MPAEQKTDAELPISDTMDPVKVEVELKGRLLKRDKELDAARKRINAAHNPKINKCKAMLRFLK